MHRIPFRDVPRAQIVVHLHLLVWVLQERLATQLQAGWEDEWCLEEEWTEPGAAQPEAILEPSWPDLLASRPTSVGVATNTLLVMQLGLTQVQQIVRGSCSLWRLQAAWPSLQRYRGTCRRRRQPSVPGSPNAWLRASALKSAHMVVTLRFIDVSHNGQPDMQIDIAGIQSVLINDRGTFRPPTAAEQQQVMRYLQLYP